MIPISACVISHNEEEHIRACLESLQFCSEVVLVDSGSTDRTVEIAESMGARVVENKPFPGHVEQKNFCLSLAENEWVLSLDCDEMISPALAEEIREKREAGFIGFQGYSMPRLNWYLGKAIRHGAFWPDRKIRLFSRKFGKWGGLNPHDRVEIDGDVKSLRGEIIHYPYKNLQEHLDTIDKFTSIAAQAMQDKNRRAGLADICFRPPAFFLKSFFIKLGFLDGWRGLLIATLGAKYTHLKWRRLAALRKKGG